MGREQRLGGASRRSRLRPATRRPDSISPTWIPALAAALILSSSATSGQGGKALLENFPPAAYDAHQQNWDVTQAADGTLYVANSDGILAFDGARWERIRGEPGQRFYAVHAGSDGRIYAGSAGDFGYLRRSDGGEHAFASLLDGASDDPVDFNQIRWIEETAEGIFFLATDRLFRLLAEGDLRSWSIADVTGRDATDGIDDSIRFRQLLGDEDRLIVAVSGVGLMRFQDGRFELLPHSDELGEHEVGGLASHPAGLLIATFDAGLFVYDGQTVRPLPGRVSELAAVAQVMGVTRLAAGSYALSTLGGGLLVSDAEGSILRRVDHRSELADDSVLNAGFTDSTGGLWLPLNNGLARVAVERPLEYFDDATGLSGTVVGLARHDDMLYAATSQGLFRLSPPGASDELGRWERVPGSPTFCWDLLSSGRLLVVATGEGLFVHEPRRGSLEAVMEGVFYSLVRETETGRLYAATADSGLLAFTPDGATLHPEPPIAGVPRRLRRAVRGRLGALWLVHVRTDGSEGLIRVSPSASAEGAPAVESFGAADGLPERDQLQPFLWRDSVWVAGAATGLLRYRPERNRFEPPDESALLSATAAGVEQVAVDGDDALWLAPGRGTPRRLRWLDDGVQIDRPLAGDPARTTTALLAEPNTLWAATGDGRIVHHDGRLESPRPLPEPRLRALFSSPERPELTVRGSDSRTGFELPFDYRSARFEFALPSFDRPTANSFQSRLRGLDEGWSSWTHETYRDYPGLRDGSYRFEMRARDVYGRTTEVRSAPFRILPPWYRTPWAYAGLSLLGCSVLWAGVSLRQRGTRRRFDLLRAEIAERESIEQALRGKDRMLSEAERLARLGSWEWDPATNSLRGSDEFNRIYGFDGTETLTPEVILDRIHLDDRDRVRDRWLGAVKQRKPDSVEYRLEYAPGRFRTLYADSQLIEDDEGRFVRMAGMVRDITEEKRAQVALRESDERYRAFVRQSLEGMVRFELDPPMAVNTPVAEQIDRLYRHAIVAECNAAFARMYGFVSPEELIGRQLADFSSPPEGDERSWIEQFLTGDYQFSGELSERDQTGREREFRRTVTGIFEHGRLVRVWSTQSDIEQRKRQERRLAYLASFDSLTDLPNRVLFEDRMLQGLAQARRSGRRIGVHYLDLDNFKNVNDTLGHSIGDELLSAVANRLRRLIRESDTVARLGGDEFAIIQLDIETPRESVVALAEKVIGSLAAPFELGGQEIHTGASIGIAVSTEKASPELLMTQADTALHKAKEAGRNTYRFYSDEMAREVQVYVDLTNDLRHALERGEFALEYQPLVRLDDGRCVGLEALLRWDHPKRGRLAPDAFIHVAESTGLITRIGQWVLEQACAQCRRWLDDGFDPVPVSVNLSAVQFKQPKLGRRILETLASTRLPPHLLELELTETTLMAGDVEVTRTFDELRDRGVSFAIDDFGTGYSSLQYVSSFPVSKLKIALEFVRNIDQPENRAIVEAVINLGNAIGLSVLAEGVETAEQASVLRRSGCNLAQGYLFSKPMRPHKVHGWLRATTGRRAGS